MVHDLRKEKYSDAPKPLIGAANFKIGKNYAALVRCQPHRF